ncbi:MAG TPA: phospholipid carrier-dependent glycosyltransferase, partial [Candidatus Omnitrophota bacterium]|nr:phospholipid carrier-dependent glycosyltransferase [Candidatus Omnitrophota bacterium]
MTLSQRLKETLVCLGIFALSFFILARGAEKAPFHVDEDNWVHYAVYFKVFFMDRNADPKIWDGLASKDQPPVGKYLNGLALWLHGYRDGDFLRLDRTGPYDFSKTYEWNLEKGLAIDPKTLLICRRAAAFFAALACAFLYGAASLFFGRTTALLASLLLLINPLVLFYGRHAMTDTPLLCFMTLNLWLTGLFSGPASEGKWQKALGIAAVLGIGIGLAAGTKLNGVLSGIIFAAWCLVLWAYQRKPVYLAAPIFAAGIAIFLFISINPFFYREPINKIRQMTAFRSELSKIYQIEQPHLALDNIAGKAQKVFERTLMPGEKNYTSISSRVRIPLDVALFLLGVLTLILRTVKDLARNKNLSPAGLTLLYALILFAGTVAWIPMDWGRYFLPLVPPVVMFSALGVD